MLGSAYYNGDAAGSRSSSRCSDADGCRQPSADTPAAPGPCIKCGEHPAQALVRVRERLCAGCLRSQLQGKFRTAVRLGGVLRPGDHIAVAFSGGASSSVLLRFLEGMRCEAGPRPERSKTPFTLTILHVDEGVAAGLDESAAAAAAAAVEAAAAPYLGSPAVRFCQVSLEDVFAVNGSSSSSSSSAGGSSSDGSAAAGSPWQCAAEERQQRRAALAALLAAVPDTTGREDLLSHLRTRLLLATASRLEVAKVARGENATRLATHVIAAAAKGRGYSLSGDVHLIDARHGPGSPLSFFPLRELGARELALVAHFEHLPLLPSACELAAASWSQGSGGGLRAARQRQRSLNALSERFVAGLQAHNSGSAANILGTAAKLTAFPWNTPPELACALGDKARRNRGQHLPGAAAAQSGSGASRAAAAAAHAEPPSALCPLCSAPLAEDELPELTAEPTSSSSSETAAGATAAAGEAVGPLPFCLSCRSEILGQTPGSSAVGADSNDSAGILELLPPDVRQEAQRFAAAGRNVGAAAAAAAAEARRALSPEELRQQIAELLLE